MWSYKVLYVLYVCTNLQQMTMILSVSSEEEEEENKERRGKEEGRRREHRKKGEGRRRIQRPATPEAYRAVGIRYVAFLHASRLSLLPSQAFALGQPTI